MSDLLPIKRTAEVARIPLDAPATERSATLVLDPMGYLSAQITFLGEPVQGLHVTFCTADQATGKTGDPVRDPHQPGKNMTQRTDATGIAKLDILVPVGNYACKIDFQPDAAITTVEAVDHPFLLALPIGRPYFDLQGAFVALPSNSGASEANDKSPTGPLHYHPAEGITIPEGVKPKLKQISDAYYQQTGKDVTVTSGPRSAEGQAKAMFQLMEKNSTAAVHKQYANKTLVDEIIQAYKDNDYPVQPMTDVIKAQMGEDKYISQHLRGGAVDIRTSDMSESDQAAFKKASADAGADCQDETDSKAGAHFHLQDLL